MKPFFKYFIVVFLLAALQLTAGRLRAQENKVPGDSSAVHLRSISNASLGKYRDDKEFNYSQQHAEGMSLWDRFWAWVNRNIGRAASDNAWWSFIKLVLWGLCISAFVYAILKFTGMQRIGLFTGNKKAEELDYVVTEDDIYAINFNEAIAKAIEQKNYRLGIRLLYLQTLRRMADRELIRWKLNKTNDVYAQELFGSDYYKDFAWLTLAYDYAWYGDFPVREDRFAELQQHFQTFQRQLPG
ncbi:MAG TPA: DUF4129 domain-containing protein [Chitinophagaceae bacterium]